MIEEVISLDKHITELRIGDALFRVFDPLLDGFLGDHRIHGHVFSDVAQEFEVIHILVEIIVIDHLVLELYVIVLFDVLKKMPELVIDALLVVAQLLFGQERSFRILEARIADHSCSATDQEITCISIFHEMDGGHDGKHIPDLERIRRRVESDIEFLSSFIQEIEYFFIGELVDDTTLFSFFTEFHYDK